MIILVGEISNQNRRMMFKQLFRKVKVHTTAGFLLSMTTKIVKFNPQCFFLSLNLLNGTSYFLQLSKKLILTAFQKASPLCYKKKWC